MTIKGLAGMGKFRLEIRPWLSTAIDPEETGPIVLEQETVNDVTLGSVLRKLGSEHPTFDKLFFNPDEKVPNNTVAIVKNGMILQSLKELDVRLADGDSIILMGFLDGG